jgi:hypothetical protein
MSLDDVIARSTWNPAKYVYDLNGLASPEWNTLPARYGPTGDPRWAAYTPKRGGGP